MATTEFMNEKYRDLKATAEFFSKQYAEAKPFPSISFENFFNPEMLEEVLAEFPDLNEKGDIKFKDRFSVKLAGEYKTFTPKIWAFMHFLTSAPFLEFLQIITGIEEKLIPDPYYKGGGLHEIKKGGMLKVHADFNKHPTTHLDRRINVLVYLNKDWEEEWGGHFELWDEEMENCVSKVAPHFNTMAMFSTTDFSYHGHPDELNCPEDRSRKSLALYYYTNGRPAHEVIQGQEKHSTLFKERKGVEGDKRLKESFFKKVMRNITPPIMMRLWRKVFG